jgi:hypothetical protein
LHESFSGHRLASAPTPPQRVEVFVQRAGVCRDVAHLGITLYRSIEYSGAAGGWVCQPWSNRDFHAVFGHPGDGVSSEGRYAASDGICMAPADRLVRIGTGRDAKIVAFATILVAFKCSAAPDGDRERPRMSPPGYLR